MENTDDTNIQAIADNAVVKNDRLFWRAVYEDGSFLWQYTEKGKPNKYEDIDRAKLVRFDMFDTKTLQPIHSVYLREGQQLIYRRKTLINFIVKFGKVVGKDPKKPKIIIYMTGWKQTIQTNSGPKTIIALNYIHEDGSIALDGPRSDIKLRQGEM